MTDRREPVVPQFEDATDIMHIDRVLKMAAIAIALAGAVAATTVTSAAQRQGRPGGRGAGAAILDQPGVTPAEIQRMFDAAALVRAQDALKLDDDKYLQFLAKYKALQDVRRRLQIEHNRLIVELRRLANDPAS